MSEIKPSDVVTLKSGGIAMTVEKIAPSVEGAGHPEVAGLIWLDTQGLMHREGAISVALLTKKV